MKEGFEERNEMSVTSECIRRQRCSLHNYMQVHMQGWGCWGGGGGPGGPLDYVAVHTRDQENA